MRRMTVPWLLATAVFGSTALAGDPTAPATRVEPVVDVYHGVRVEDPYRWLENGTDPAVRE